MLSLIQPGIGQIYNGQLNKGIFVILLGYCYIPLLYFIAFYGLSALTIISLVIIGAAYYIVVIADSIVVAKKSTDYTPKKYNNIYVYIAALIILGSISHFYADYVKHNFIEAFRFPSGSMDPTLLVGDHIIVDRSPAARNPKRGDIVVFESPQNGKNFLKRVVAIGGDCG